MSDFETEIEEYADTYLESGVPRSLVLVVTTKGPNGDPLPPMVQRVTPGETVAMMANAWATGPDRQPQLIQLPIEVQVQLA